MRYTKKIPNFKPAKRLKFGEEKQRSGMKFSAALKGDDGNGMSEVCFDDVGV